jgi:hypothetical protein
MRVMTPIMTTDLNKHAGSALGHEPAHFYRGPMIKTWKKLLYGRWDWLDDDMLREEVNVLCAPYEKQWAEEQAQRETVNFLQIPGAPPVRMVRKEKS